MFHGSFRVGLRVAIRSTGGTNLPRDFLQAATKNSSTGHYRKPESNWPVLADGQVEQHHRAQQGAEPRLAERKQGHQNLNVASARERQQKHCATTSESTSGAVCSGCLEVWVVRLRAFRAHAESEADNASSESSSKQLSPS